MRNYVKPEMNVILLEKENDVIVTSVCTCNGGY